MAKIGTFRVRNKFFKILTSQIIKNKTTFKTKRIRQVDLNMFILQNINYHNQEITG
jgi:hypothetical protein